MAKPAPDRVRVSGPLAAFADGFFVDLVEQGYRLWPAQRHLYFLASVSRWMEAEGLGVEELTPRAMERFVAERRRVGYRSSVSPKSLRPLLGYLGRICVLPAGDDQPPTPIDRLLAEFRGYLLVERGVTPGTVGQYEPVARMFLEERSEPIADDLAGLSGREIQSFVLREARRRGQRQAELMVCALRAMLRFLHVEGWIATPLAAAVPSVRKRREGLPRGLAIGQVQRLLDSCDRDTPAGAQQRLLALSFSLGLAETQPPDGSPEAAKLAHDAKLEVVQAIEELRELARGIHPTILTDRGLAVALQTVAARSPVPVALSIGPERLPEPIETAAYYLVCEAIANATKHSKATRVAVTIARRNDNVVIEISDDGVGGASAREGSGLRGLVDRVEALDGTLFVTSPAGAGTTIHGEIPCA